MQVSDAVSQRTSIRQFTNDPVDDALVRELLTLAARSPSGGNTQPWHVYVLTGDAKKSLTEAVFERMDNGEMGDEPEFHIYPKADASADYMRRRRKLGYEMYSLMGIERDDVAGRINAMKSNFDFFGAPVGIIVTVDRIAGKNGWGHVGMFMQTLCLLASERGLSTCLQEAWSQFNASVYDKVGIDKEKEMVWAGIALGHADTAAKVNELRSDREPLDKFATFLTSTL